MPLSLTVYKLNEEAMTIGSIVLAPITCANLLFGIDIKNINGWFRDRLKNWLFQKEAKKLGVDTKQ